MVTTADGRATIGGRSGPIGNEADQDLFHALRTRVDAVMVGAGTLRAEKYGRLVRKPERREARDARGARAGPARGHRQRPARPAAGPAAAPRARAAGARRHLLRRRACRAADIEYLRFNGGAVDIPRLLAILRGRGMRSVLCEGGPTLNAELLRAGAVDELFHCIAPEARGRARRAHDGDGRSARDSGDEAGLAAWRATHTSLHVFPCNNACNRRAEAGDPLSIQTHGDEAHRGRAASAPSAEARRARSRVQGRHEGL